MMGFLGASSTTSVMGALANVQQCVCQFTWRTTALKKAELFKFRNRYVPVFIQSQKISCSSALRTQSKDPEEGFRWNRYHDKSVSNKADSDSKYDFKQVKKVKANSSRTTTMFFDSLRIFVKAGIGGKGFPSMGGIGGKGGDVVVIGHKDMNLKQINDLYPSRRFSAFSGTDSKLFCLNGMPGKTVLIPVPLGVQVVTELGHVLGEVNTHGEKLVVAKGGMGGSPSNGYFAEKGQSHNVKLDLKLIADVGFVGFPNAGKSTLLKALSRASPKIASYPFTTIRPNVGVIEFRDYRRITLADLPGLIEGAHINIGMGHKFLKHVERTKMLLFVVDIHGFTLGPEYPYRSALETIVLLNKELELYKEELTETPAILALNKMDLPGSLEIIYKIKDTLSNKKSYEEFLGTLPEEFWPENVILFDDIIPISAATDDISVRELKRKLRRLLDINDTVENDLVPTSINN